jgi:sugar lactone lactonase YvrE
MYISSVDLVRIFTRENSIAQADVATSGATVINTTYKAAARIATDDVNVARSGTAATADTSATNPATPTRITIGARGDNATPLFGYIRRIAAVQGAGTDADLIAMTS